MFLLPASLEAVASPSRGHVPGATRELRGSMISRPSCDSCCTTLVLKLLCLPHILCSTTTTEVAWPGGHWRCTPWQSSALSKSSLASSVASTLSRLALADLAATRFTIGAPIGLSFQSNDMAHPVEPWNHDDKAKPLTWRGRGLSK